MPHNKLLTNLDRLTYLSLSPSYLALYLLLFFSLSFFLSLSLSPPLFTLSPSVSMINASLFSLLISIPMFVPVEVDALSLERIHTCTPPSAVNTE